MTTVIATSVHNGRLAVPAPGFPGGGAGTASWAATCPAVPQNSASPNRQARQQPDQLRQPSAFRGESDIVRTIQSIGRITDRQSRGAVSAYSTSSKGCRSC